MPRSIIAVEMVKEAKLPYIVFLVDPTTGGVSASFAMVGDIHLAEPGATIGFAGRRVIEETVRETLPDDFQTAEYLKERGMVDMVVPRNEMHATVARILNLLMSPNNGGGKQKGLLGRGNPKANGRAGQGYAKEAGAASTRALKQVKAARETLQGLGKKSGKTRKAGGAKA